MPEDMSDRMPEDMPDRMPEDMPDRMPEDMSDRMPEDLPVRKCKNVTVGITRSKVFFSIQQRFLSRLRCSFWHGPLQFDSVDTNWSNTQTTWLQ